MQIFRYMVYIWEKYERDEEKRHKGSTKRKGFMYPPILPIVYYEGTAKWTAPMEFRSKILLGSELTRYLPNFSYYLVPIQKYSNESLLEHGNEISFVMLINKLQTKEDIELFRQLPPEKVASILKDTPDYLLEIIAKIFRAFLLNVNVPEDETEELTELVKERKMGQLFANAEKMDIQAERRKTEKANRKAEEANRKAEEANRKVEEEHRKAEEAIDRGVRLFVLGMQELGKPKDVVIERIQAEYGLTKEVIEEKVNQYWKS